MLFNLEKFLRFERLFFIKMLTYALIGVNQKKLDNVKENIQTIAGEEINKLFTVYGEYDLVLKLKSVNAKKARETLTKIRALDGVNSLSTGVVTHSTHEEDVQPDSLNLI